MTNPRRAPATDREFVEWVHSRHQASAVERFVRHQWTQNAAWLTLGMGLGLLLA